MIKKHLLILSSLFLLFACDQIGSSRIKNLIDLTPPLSVDHDKRVIFDHKELASQTASVDTAKVKLINFASTDIISEPAVAKKVFYAVEKSGFVSAYSLKDNKKLWRTNIKGDIVDRFFIGGGILYSDDKLYVTFGTRYLVVLDAATGIEEFRKEFADIIRIKPVMAENNKLLVQTVSNKLYAINAKNYNTIWAHEEGLQTINIGEYIHPILFENAVIASFSTGELLALNLDNGKPLWRYFVANHDNVTTPGFVPATIQTQPIIHNDSMYFATGNGKLVRIYLYTGLPVWLKEAHDILSMSLYGDKLFVTNNARQIAAIDANNGEINWVGNLITEEIKQKKKIKTVKFTEPFVQKIDDSYEINVAANNGELYSFRPNESGKLPIWPETISITKGVRYLWPSCCDGRIHFITNRAVTDGK